MLKKISFGLLFIAFIICFGLWFEHHRVWQENVRETEFNCRVNKHCFSGGGPHTYGFLAEQYMFVLIFLISFCVGKIIKPPILSITICLSSVILIFYQLSKVRDWYLNLINVFSYYNTEPFFSLLRNSVPFIWIFLSILIGLAIVEIVIFSKSITKNN